MSGLVHVNGLSVTRHDHPMFPEDLLEVWSERAAPVRSLPFAVLYEDAHLVVIDKPNGLLTVGNKREKSRTVEAMLNKAWMAERTRCFIVQRLDLYTSGVLLVAKTAAAQATLQKNWGSSRKVYHALVEGIPEPKEACLSHYLTEDERLLMRASLTESSGAVKAILNYWVIAERGVHALVRVELKTGKKNQIRVQMAFVGHPIAGDAKYGARTNPIGRLCLHASSLEFAHPKTGKPMKFEVPMPKGFS